RHPWSYPPPSLVVVEFSNDVFQNVPVFSLPVRIGVRGGLASWPEPHPETKPITTMMHENRAIRITPPFLRVVCKAMILRTGSPFLPERLRTPEPYRARSRRNDC